MSESVSLRPFLDEQGRITQLPHRQKVKRAVLEYLIGKFEPDTAYTERQINGVCNQWHTFGDYFLLRRELVDSGLLNRTPDGACYRRVAQPQSAATEE